MFIFRAKDLHEEVKGRILCHVCLRGGADDTSYVRPRSPAGECNFSTLSEISQAGHKTLGKVRYGTEMHSHAQNTFLTTISFGFFFHFLEQILDQQHLQ